jgi:ABC-type enterochelin transport system ATPase subunit
MTGIGPDFDSIPSQLVLESVGYSIHEGAVEGLVGSNGVMKAILGDVFSTERLLDQFGDLAASLFDVLLGEELLLLLSLP